MADRAGQQLGNYQLLKLIGRGGFADVYLGEHVRLGNQAAIKVLQTRLESDDIESFQQEARTIGRLAHPNIVRVFDFAVQDGTPFLAMDYAPNGTLRQRHGRGVKLPVETLLVYVKQMADALQYAHEQKVIHRDIIISPALAAITGALAGAGVAHFDETGFRVAGKLAWVHSASAGKFVLVTVHPKRGKDGMDAAGVLPAFVGIACHDAWKPYDSYNGVAGFSLCGAHYPNTVVMPIPGGRCGLAAVTRVRDIGII